jgi:hypothetical protein
MGTHERTAAGDGLEVTMSTGSRTPDLAVSHSDDPEGPPPSARPETSETSRSFGLLEKFLTLATAVLVLISTILGFQVKSSADANHDQALEVNSLKDTSASLRRQLTDLTEQNLTW